MPSRSAEAPSGSAVRARSIDRPVVVEVRGIDKTFRIPSHRMDSLKERATHPFTPREYRELRALRDVSFDVHQGEFFGIVGRNGSGKSSLLKILASIYRADAGRVRAAGRVAPFIELGVGFNPELTSRENVVLNGVMMGLSRREAQRRLGAVLEFADLEEFVELKLKNYSSGMLVRLAFAVMVQAQADIMLIDEVLAVGDAAFAQKCMDVFRQKRDAGKTIVLVTHDMTTVQGLCDRAMLLHDGEAQYLGDPEEAAMRYYRLNFQAGEIPGAGAGAETDAVPDVHARVLDAWLEDATGERIENVEQDQPIRIGIVLQARRELVEPIFGIRIVNLDDVQVLGFNKTLTLAEEQPDAIAPGQRVRLAGTIENPLLSGRYFLDCYIARKRQTGLALQRLRLCDFTVYGTRPAIGAVAVHEDVEALPESDV
jgi:ABC-type polysaccharide/polyol phosphate transport system ATPase subunit